MQKKKVEIIKNADFAIVCELGFYFRMLAANIFFFFFYLHFLFYVTISTTTSVWFTLIHSHFFTWQNPV